MWIYYRDELGIVEEFIGEEYREIDFCDGFAYHEQRRRQRRQSDRAQNSAFCACQNYELSSTAPRVAV